MSERILIVAAHPDDEVLGVGATAARHAQAGDLVQALILGEGATSRGGGGDEVEALRRAARAASHTLGAAPPSFGGLPDNRMDEVALLDIVRIVEGVCRELQPTIVYTHCAGDLNVDHRLANAAVLTACRPLPQASVRAIYAFETPSSTEWAAPERGAAFLPTRFVDVAAAFELKLAALDCYRSEMRPFPHPRSREAVLALAQWRGASAGLTAAEAFQVVREIL